MSQHTDPIDLLRAYAPTAVVEPPGEELVERVLRQNGRRTPTTTRRRVGVLGAALAVTLVGAGVGAAAAGVTPAGVWNRVFGAAAPATRAYEVDPSTARKVFTAAAPDGQEFAAWTITNRVGWRCVATFVEAPGTTAAPRQLLDGSTPHSCGLQPPTARGLFADGTGTSSLGARDRLSFAWESGDAARAELRLSTGAVLPVAVEGGWLGGSYTRDQVPLGVTATIVAYAADGHRLGSFLALDQSGCDQPAGC